jgi:hypothetical protein
MPIAPFLHQYLVHDAELPKLCGVLFVHRVNLDPDIAAEYCGGGNFQHERLKGGLRPTVSVRHSAGPRGIYRNKCGIAGTLHRVEGNFY